MLAPCLVALLVLSTPPASAAPAVPVAVDSRDLSILVDTSMEFLFVYDHLAGFLRREGYQVTQNRGTLRTKLLDDYDIVLVQQLTTPLEFDPEFIDGLEQWV